jgi:DNA-binding MarR family transcriptional regulator
MDFDKLVHQPTRLKIFAYLYQHGKTGFSTLVDELDVTEGNLASHIQKLEDAGCVLVEKEIVDQQARTSYRLTDHGRAKFEDHLVTLESLIDQLDQDD